MTDPEIPDRGYTTSDVAAVPPARRSFVRRHWGKLTLAVIVLVPAGVQLIRSYAALAFTYSTGDRIGYVQKLSKKGWLCKTWEGELQISNIPGSAPVLFDFTVRDDSLARAIQATEGKQIAVTYDQHPGIPLSCFGETEYFVTAVRTLNPQPGLPGVPPELVPPAPVVPSAPIPPVPQR
ncbi:MAG: hypothetical protein IPF98_11925 [Gemmatimonadetes bacterium]|nr:hypothetical protein [Gemmatimonadota bacterium]MCC6769614.1 hypothetical protein [Gemmatimonadaceae bacterium]